MRIFILFLFAVVALSATTATYRNVTTLYVATFDRVPDVDGVKYWVNDSGLDLEEIARSFMLQPESADKYYPEGLLAPDEFVDTVYLNVFDHLPDDAGKKYWVDDIGTSFDRASVFILAVINGAQGEDAAILKDKTDYAWDFIKNDLPQDAQTCSPFYHFNEDEHDYFYTGEESDRVRWYCRYYQDGRLFIERQYVDGKKEGIGREYWEDGSLKSKTFYDNGDKKRFEEYNTYGQMIHCTMYNSDGYQWSCMP